jgi:hypothetical protein
MSYRGGAVEQGDDVLVAAGSPKHQRLQARVEEKRRDGVHELTPPVSRRSRHRRAACATRRGRGGPPAADPDRADRRRRSQPARRRSSSSSGTCEMSVEDTVICTSPPRPPASLDPVLHLIRRGVLTGHRTVSGIDSRDSRAPRQTEHFNKAWVWTLVWCVSVQGGTKQSLNNSLQNTADAPHGGWIVDHAKDAPISRMISFVPNKAAQRQRLHRPIRRRREGLKLPDETVIDGEVIALDLWRAYSNVKEHHRDPARCRFCPFRLLIADR